MNLDHVWSNCPFGLVNMLQMKWFLLEFSTDHLSYLLSQREFYLKVIEFERKEEARDLPIQKDFLATHLLTCISFTRN